MALYFSFTNLLDDDAVLLTPSSEDPVYVAANLKKAWRCFRPWRSASLGDQAVVIDFGGAVAPTIVFLNRTNFLSARFQMNSADSWGSPPVDVDLSADLARNVLTWRYQAARLLPAAAYRYARLLIPSQGVNDGSSSYLLGGLWLGQDLVAPPRHFLYDGSAASGSWVVGTDRPHSQLDTTTGGAQFARLGNARATFAMPRFAGIDRADPGYADEFQAWSEIERHIWESRRALMMFSQRDPTQSWIVQLGTDPSYTRQNGMIGVTSTLSLVEDIGP